MDWLSPQATSGATIVLLLIAGSLAQWRLNRIERKLDGTFEPIPTRVAILETQMEDVKSDVRELQGR